jgi:hypothetical protein
VKEEKKTITLKSSNKKHDFTLTKTTIGGHVFISLKKNSGNPIIKCSPKEFIKFKRLINESW